MIKVKYDKIGKPEFQQAMMKLSNTPSADWIAGFKVRKMNEALKAAREFIFDEYKKLVADYAKKDDQGNFEIESFEVMDGKEEEFKKAHGEFGQREVEIKRKKLTLKDVSHLKLTPNEQEGISVLVDESSLEEQETNVIPLTKPQE